MKIKTFNFFVFDPTYVYIFSIGSHRWQATPELADEPAGEALAA